MNPYVIYSEHLNTYGEVEGRDRFLELCEEMKHRERNKRWGEIEKQIKNNEI